MPTLVSHSQYIGRTPSITLSGGSSATDRIVIVMSFSDGDGAVVTAATVDGNAATVIGTSVDSGGVEASVSVLELQGIGPGTFSTTVTGPPAAGAQYFWDVYEFSAANQADNFTTNNIGSVVTVPYDISLAANASTGDTVIFAMMAGEGGGTGTESITDDATLSSLDQSVSAGALTASGYKSLASDNETVTFTVDGTNAGGGGNVDRVTMVSVRVPQGVVSPSLTLNQTTLTPSGTISGTCTNYSAAPTSPITVSDGTNTDNVTVTISGTGPYTFTGTMPSSPTVAEGSVTVTVGEASTTATYSDGVTEGLPAFTLQKDGTTLGNLTGIKCTIVAGTDMSGSELYFASNLTATAGVMDAIDLSATAASVGDTVTVSILTTDNEGITFTTTVENLQA